MKKIAFAIIGWLVLLIGIVMIPYPGPGWAVVFAGLLILSKEYHWARRLLKYSKHRYESYQHWVSLQPLYIRSLMFIATGIVVVATLWLLNVYGTANDWLDLGYEWMNSPLLR